MKPIKSVFTLCMALFFSMGLLNCGSPDDTVWTDDGGTNDSTQTGITIDKLNYNGYEAALINSEDLFIDQSYYGSLDTQTVEFHFVSEKVLSFSVPNMNDGQYILKVDGFDEQFELTITNTKEVDEPISSIEIFVGDYETDIDKIIAHTKKLDSLGFISNVNEEIIRLENAKDSVAEALQKLNQLSTAEQQIVAQVINANQENINELNRILDGVYEDGSFKKGVCTGREDWSRAMCLTREMLRGVVYMVGPGAIAGIAAGELSLGIGATAGAIIGSIIGYKVVDYGRARFVNAFIELVNWAFIPADNVLAEVEALKKTLVFQNNKEKEIEFSFATRTINEVKDKDHAELGLVFKLLKAFNYINEEILKLPIFSLPSEKPGIYTPKDLSSLEVEVIGNEKVDGELIIVGEKLSLRLYHDEPETQLAKMRMYVDYGGQTIYSEEIDIEVEELQFNYEGSWHIQFYTMRSNAKVEYLHQEEKFTLDENGEASTRQVRYPDNPAPVNEWKTQDGPVNIKFENGELIIDDYWDVDVADVDDQIFYSENWNYNYEIGDYYWKIKLMRL